MTWGGDSSLKKAFLELFGIGNGILQWDLNFSRPVQDWELEPLSAFMDLIYSNPVSSGDDKQSTKRQGFEVKGYCCSLVSNSDKLFPPENHLEIKGATQSCFLFVDCSLGKDFDNRQCVEETLVIDQCYMCKCNEETVDHLLPTILQL